MKITFNATLLRYAAESQDCRHLAYMGLKLSGSIINISSSSQNVLLQKCPRDNFPLFIQITKIKQKTAVLPLKKQLRDKENIGCVLVLNKNDRFCPYRGDVEKKME